MKKYFVDSYKLLNKNEKKQLIFFFILTCGSLFFETLSIGALYPLFSAFIVEDFDQKFPFLEKLFESLNFNYSSEHAVFYASILVLVIFVVKNIFLIYFLFWQSNFYKKIRLRIKSELLRYYINETYLFQINNNSSYLIRNITFTADQAITNIYNCMILIIESSIFIGLLIFPNDIQVV